MLNSSKIIDSQIEENLSKIKSIEKQQLFIAGIIFEDLEEIEIATTIQLSLMELKKTYENELNQFYLEQKNNYIHSSSKLLKTSK